MLTKSFDKFFLHLPPFDRQNDFEQFWENSLKELKKIPITPQISNNRKKSKSKFKVFDATYKSFKKATITGDLYYPKSFKKSKPVILIHDYNNKKPFSLDHLDKEMAYFFLKLRGHDLIPDEQPEEYQTPGYMIDNILNKDNYYLKGIFLDVIRAIDMLRLTKKFDCSSIGIIGKGLGAAAAMFTAAYSKRVKAVVLDTPSFCYLPFSQNLSTSDTTKEINNFISAHKPKRSQVKKNLTYFDAINFSDKINCPVLSTVGLHDTISPPECVFALFNHILTDKTIEVYPDDENSAGGGKQLEKSLAWIKKQIF